MATSMDMSLDMMKQYKPELTRQEDFEDFWTKTLTKERSHDIGAEYTEIHYPVAGVRVYDIHYRGCEGQKVRGWYLMPAHANSQNKVPVLMHFSGYTWGRGYPSQYMVWALQGYAVLAIDNRGQAGTTPDNRHYSHGAAPGWFTKGILDKEEYYYKGVYVDAVRALDFLETRPEVDMKKIGLMGGSQGGGTALAVAALDNRPAYAMITFPFMCNLERAFNVSAEKPYMELTEYFKLFDPEMKTKEKVFETLSYFDMMNHAQNIKCPVLMAIALMDPICLASTVFAAYNHMNCHKECFIYPLHGHETLFSHEEHMLRFAAKYSL